MVDGLAKKHFPMCMRTLHDNLQRDNHLKYFGRLQYGLFLKVRLTDIGRNSLVNICSQVLGLSIDEAIIFWRKSFNRITDDKFNKEYKYNIRHSYGLEGRRHNYTAKRCDVSILQDHSC
jgi:DNA primase large subunit